MEPISLARYNKRQAFFGVGDDSSVIQSRDSMILGDRKTRNRVDGGETPQVD